MNDIWILGATGRSGRAIAADLVARGGNPVLSGRNAGRLREVADQLGPVRTVPVRSLDSLVAEFERNPPAVVVNTIGPFTETALPVIRACPPGTHYVDLSNELTSVTDLLDAHDAAVAADRCVVTGAGFGVLATESIVLTLCADGPPPARVRVDAAPAVDSPGPIGHAVAASMVDVLAAGGFRYENGRLARARLGDAVEQLALPDGSTVRTSSVPSADLVAARRASAAPSVVAASTMIPTGRATRALLSAGSALLSLPGLRAAAKRLIARVRLDRSERNADITSWSHARVEWDDGRTEEGWVRTGDETDFTTRAAAEVAFRLANGGSIPGAHTPGSLFGPELAECAGGHILVNA